MWLAKRVACEMLGAIVAMLVLLRQRHPLYAHVTGNKEAHDALPGGGWLGVDDLAADQVLDPPRVSAVDPGGGSGGSGVPHAVPMSADRGLQEEQERQDREVLTESGLSSSGALHGGKRPEASLLRSAVNGARRREK